MNSSDMYLSPNWSDDDLDDLDDLIDLFREVRDLYVDAAARGNAVLSYLT